MAGLDTMRDAVGLVRAALEGDHDATETLLDNADLRDVTAALADLAGTLLKVADGDAPRALGHLARWQARMIQAEDGGR